MSAESVNAFFRSCGNCHDSEMKNALKEGVLIRYCPRCGAYHMTDLLDGQDQFGQSCRFMAQGCGV